MPSKSPGRSATTVRLRPRKLAGGSTASEASPPHGEEPTRGTIPIARPLAQSGTEIDELERQIQRSVDNGRTVVEIDPTRIRRARLSDRADGFTNDTSYRELRTSIERDGQHQPVGVRRLALSASDGPEYETCWGHRRIAACRDLGRPVLAIIVQPDDMRAAMMGYAENTRRAGTSYIEQGRFFAALLDRRVFLAQQDIARALQVSKTRVSQALQAAEIPDEILNTIGDWRRCTKRQAMALRKAMDTPDGLQKMRAAIAKATRSKGGIRAKVAVLCEAAAPAARYGGVRRHQRDATGRSFVKLEKDAESIIYRFAKGIEPEFVEFVWERLPGLRAEFDKKTGARRAT
jgi:ParB family transcriptional regulator, chromosome partitioning protein